MTATDPLPIAQALIRRRSMTPADDGAIGAVEDALRPLGVRITRMPLMPGELAALIAAASAGVG